MVPGARGLLPLTNPPGLPALALLCVTCAHSRAQTCVSAPALGEGEQTGGNTFTPRLLPGPRETALPTPWLLLADGRRCSGWPLAWTPWLFQSWCRSCPPVPPTDQQSSCCRLSSSRQLLCGKPPEWETRLWCYKSLETGRSGLSSQAHTSVGPRCRQGKASYRESGCGLVPTVAPLALALF